MKVEEIAQRLSDLELRFEGLKETMLIFQDNISNNISWFYTVVGIMVALIGAVAVALYFMVKSAVKTGVEKGISDVTSTVQTEIKQMYDNPQILKYEVRTHTDEYGKITIDFSEFEHIDDVNIDDIDALINMWKVQFKSRTLSGENVILEAGILIEKFDKLIVTLAGDGVTDEQFNSSCKCKFYFLNKNFS